MTQLAHRLLLGIEAPLNQLFSKTNCSPKMANADDIASLFKQVTTKLISLNLNGFVRFRHFTFL